MLGVSRQRMAELAARPDFPKPAAVLAAGNIRNTHEVEEWAGKTGRELNQL
ncbi:MAG TPA: hypothetical protein VER39_02525 [Nocardioidaceae bacterium]|nr:hypothetical protein [Nocardioidaceae bacterium]